MASKDLLSISKTRHGRRSMSVSTLLRKEKEGTLYKKAANDVGPTAPPEIEGNQSPGLVAAGLGALAVYSPLRMALYGHVIPDEATPRERKMLADMMRQARREGITIRRDPSAPGGLFMHKPIPKFLKNFVPYKLPKKYPAILYSPSFKSPAMFGHEMGHSQLQKVFPGRMLQHALTRTGLAASGLIGLTTGIAGARHSEEGRKWGIAAPSLIAAPALLGEAGASLLSLQRMRRMGANPQEIRRAIKTFLPALGIYATLPLAGTGVAMLGAGLTKTPQASAPVSEGTVDPINKLSVAGGIAASEDKKPSDFDPKQIAMGMKVEQEHTSDKEVAKRIATDHLTEIPDYYTRLKKMEDEAKKTAGVSILEFFDRHPYATDKEIEKFASNLGMDRDGLEKQAYRLLKAATISDQATIHYHDGEYPQVTGQPAHAPRKSGDVPTRMEDPYPPAKVESRQDMSGITSVGPFHAAEGRLDVGKVAAVEDRALGDQSKRWESPSREDMADSRPSKLTGPGHGFVILNDISPAISQDERDTAEDARKFSSAGMLDELAKLKAASEGQIKAAAGELAVPLAEEQAQSRISPEDAAKSLARLKRLEETKPSMGELGRAATVGAVVTPLAGLAARAAAGPKATGGLPVYRGLRDLAASATYGSVFGGLYPAGKLALEREVEKQKLREYVGDNPYGPVHSAIKRNLGV